MLESPFLPGSHRSLLQRPGSPLGGGGQTDGAVCLHTLSQANPLFPGTSFPRSMSRASGSSLGASLAWSVSGGEPGKASRQRPEATNRKRGTPRPGKAAELFKHPPRSTQPTEAGRPSGRTQLV